MTQHSSPGAGDAGRGEKTGSSAGSATLHQSTDDRPTQDRNIPRDAAVIVRASAPRRLIILEYPEAELSPPGLRVVGKPARLYCRYSLDDDDKPRQAGAVTSLYHHRVMVRATELLNSVPAFNIVPWGDKTDAERGAHRWGQINKALQRACDDLWAQINNHPEEEWPAAWDRAQEVGFSWDDLANAAVELDRKLGNT